MRFGSPTSPTSGFVPVSFTWQRFWISIPARLWAGRSPNASILNFASLPYAWQWKLGPRRVASITPIAACSTLQPTMSLYSSITDCKSACRAKAIPYDNAFMESFYKTLKYEEVHLWNYETYEDVIERLPFF